MAKRLAIVVVSEGALCGKRFEIGAGGLRLGRSSSNDVHIPDEELSRNHCLFECSGESDITVVDLSSANGTYVNDEPVESRAVLLKAGDMIRVGATEIKVVGEEVSTPAVVTDESPNGRSVDLGLGAKPDSENSPSDAAAKNVSPLIKIVTASVVGVLIVAIACVLLFKDSKAVKGILGLFSPKEAPEERVPQTSDEIISFFCEKVDADSKHIFRYCAELKRDGTVTLELDDLPGENRQLPTTEKKITDADMRLLKTIFDGDEWKSLKSEYRGENHVWHRLWRIKLVRKNGVKEVVVRDEMPPKEFSKVWADVESKINDILDCQSISMSRADIESAAKKYEMMADDFWNKRDARDGYISESIDYYTLALKEIKVLGVSEEAAARRIQQHLDEAKKELDNRCAKRYAEAKRLMDIGKYDDAYDLFSTICVMAPRGDNRWHIDAENNMKVCDGRKAEIQKEMKMRRR